jgi:hypothetical protein
MESWGLGHGLCCLRRRATLLERRGVAMGFLSAVDHLGFAGFAAGFTIFIALFYAMWIAALAFLSAVLFEAMWFVYRLCGGKGGRQKVAHFARWIAHKWLVADLKSKVVRHDS